VEVHDADAPNPVMPSADFCVFDGHEFSCTIDLSSLSLIWAWCKSRTDHVEWYVSPSPKLIYESESFGCRGVYDMDSAGHAADILHDVSQKALLLRETFKGEAEASDSCKHVAR
jgi:hypothetical protein